MEEGGFQNYIQKYINKAHSDHGCLLQEAILDFCDPLFPYILSIHILQGAGGEGEKKWHEAVTGGRRC